MNSHFTRRYSYHSSEPDCTCFFVKPDFVWTKTQEETNPSVSPAIIAPTDPGHTQWSSCLGISHLWNQSWFLLCQYHSLFQKASNASAWLWEATLKSCWWKVEMWMFDSMIVLVCKTERWRHPLWMMLACVLSAHSLNMRKQIQKPEIN